MHKTNCPATFPQYGLDWLSISMNVPDQSARRLGRGIARHLGLDTEGVITAAPRLGYAAAWSDTATGALLLADGKAPGMGAHIIWTGSALDGMRARYGNLEIVDALARAWGDEHRDYTVRRIDVAYDQQTISPGAFCIAQSQGRLVHNTRQPGTAVSSQDGGFTAASGRRGGGCYVRCYDKGAEQGEQRADGQRWFRLEYECREGLAERVWTEYVRGRWDEVGRQLARACAVRLPSSTETNRARWPIDPAWQAVLACQEAAPRTVQTPPGLSGVDDTWAWLATQTPGALALLAEAYGTPVLLAKLARLIDAGARRMGEERRAVAVAWKAAMQQRNDEL